MWVALALTSAIFVSLSTFIIKHLLHDVKPIPLLVLVHLFTIPFFVVLLIYFKIPEFNLSFLKFLIISGSLSALAAYTSYKALSISDISLLTPLSAFIPLLALLWSYLLLGETPTPIKFVGIITIVIGAYFLDIEDVRFGLLKPFTDLFSDHGVKLYLIAVLAWSLTPILEKEAIFETNPNTPIFAAFISFMISTAILVPFAIRDRIHTISIKKYWKWLTLLGALFALFCLANFTAYSLTNVAYVLAITKLAALFVIILGAFILHEKRLKERLLGGIIMVIGAILVAV